MCTEMNNFDVQNFIFIFILAEITYQIWPKFLKNFRCLETEFLDAYICFCGKNLYQICNISVLPQDFLQVGEIIYHPHFSLFLI